MLTLSGILVGSFFTALTSLLKTLADPLDTLPAITFWLLGSLTNVTWRSLPALALITVAGCLALTLIRWQLNILSLGDREAAALGVDTRRMKILITGLASLMTAVAVAVGGLIGWVGLVMPHAGRLLVGAGSQTPAADLVLPGRGVPARHRHAVAHAPGPRGAAGCVYRPDRGACPVLAVAPPQRLGVGMKLNVENLCFAFHPGQPVLQDVSFGVEGDRVVYILGHNGCGKSTLFNCLCGIYAPGPGTFSWTARISLRWPPAGVPGGSAWSRRTIPAAFPYTVQEMVLMGRAPHLGLFETPGRDDYRLADQALADVGLAALAGRSYNELSGGERRLAMVARGLVQHSDILLLDEPDAYLDPRNQHVVQETVARLAEDGRTFIITSHSPNNALLYAGRVILMSSGHLLADGRPEEVLTEGLLERAYNMPVEVLYTTSQDGPRPRAILPVRASRPGE